MNNFVKTKKYQPDISKRMKFRQPNLTKAYGTIADTTTHIFLLQFS